MICTPSTRTPRLAATAFAVTTALAGTASAATLVTPFVRANNGQRLSCEVTNIGTSPVTVELTLRDGSGQVLVPDGTTCGQTLAPQGTCAVFSFANDRAYCTIVTSGGKARAAIAVFGSDTSLVTVVPATK
jgi:hypothetical protein